MKHSYLFAVGNSFPFFLTLLVISGASIGIFKTGALEVKQGRDEN